MAIRTPRDNKNLRSHPYLVAEEVQSVPPLLIIRPSTFWEAAATVIGAVDGAVDGAKSASAAAASVSAAAPVPRAVRGLCQYSVRGHVEATRAVSVQWGLK